MTKYHQEEMVLLIGKTYGIPAVAPRFFNVYGPRQSLSNPYAGVAAIWLSRLLNGKQPIVFEDGGQLRDFVSIHDVVDCLVLMLEKPGADYLPVNVGSGETVTILDIARLLARLLGSSIEPQVTQTGRKFDIRHNTADITRARADARLRAEGDARAGLHRADRVGEDDAGRRRRLLRQGAAGTAGQGAAGQVVILDLRAAEGLPRRRWRWSTARSIRCTAATSSISAPPAQLDVPLLCNVASDRYVRNKHRAAAARGSARGGRRRDPVHQLHAHQPVRHRDDPARAAAELLRQGQGLGRAAAARAGRASAREHGIEIVYLDTVLDSSSRILKSFTEQQNQR